MIYLKNPSEIKKMTQGGKILSEVLDIVLTNIKSGIRLSQLDELAESEIRKRSAFPSFKKVKGYKWSICSCVNEEVVHGIPDDYMIRNNDIVSIDCGVYYLGFHTDAAWSIRVKENCSSNDEVDLFLSTGKKALSEAIKKIQVGNYIYDISSAIEEIVKEAGYSPVRTLVGHGIGKNLHEDPEVPCFTRGKREKTAEIVPGMVLAVEIIYNKGGSDVIYQGNDGWTIVTKDGKISGLFEATVAATNHGCLVLTPFGKFG